MIGKRKGVTAEQSFGMDRKRVKNLGFVPMREHAKVVEQLAVVHEQNEVYQSTWMREFQWASSSISFSRESLRVKR